MSRLNLAPGKMSPADLMDRVSHLERLLFAAHQDIDKKIKVINKNNNNNQYYQDRKEIEKEDSRQLVQRLRNQLDDLYKVMDITQDTSTNMYNNLRGEVKLLKENKSSVGSITSCNSRNGKKRLNDFDRTESNVVSHLHYVVDKLHDENAILREEDRINNIHFEESCSLIDALDETGPTKYAMSVRCEELSSQGNDWREEYHNLKKRHLDLRANYKEVYESEKLFKSLLTNEQSTCRELTTDNKSLYAKKAVLKYQLHESKRKHYDVSGSLISLRSHSDMSSLLSNTSPSKQRRNTQTTVTAAKICDANLELVRKQKEKRKYDLFF